ncbi:hypothetical protein BKA70DRAFT_1225857 [Coprinopsis sp. MPI-PUGE-AT-0042]|nr:hypothetical protein BKA70DRAFT_1225857 [Coprinopsis sp. MPI-PUGE-AT-0042]
MRGFVETGGCWKCNKAGDQKQPRSKQKYRRKELWDGQVGGGVPDPLGESVEANRLLKEVVTQALIEEQGLAPGTVRVTIGMAALIRDAEEILSGDSSSLIDRGESLRPCLFRALWALLSFVRLNVTRGVDDSEGNLHKIHDELENIGVGIFFSSYSLIPSWDSSSYSSPLPVYSRGLKAGFLVMDLGRGETRMELPSRKAIPSRLS